MACEGNAALSAAGCYLCLDNKQQSAAMLALLCQILQQLDPMASCEISDLRAASQSYQVLGFREMVAIQLHLLCSISNNLGGIGRVVTSTVDPVDDPGVDSQVWVNRTTGQVWYWNDGTAAWVLLIS